MTVPVRQTCGDSIWDRICISRFEGISNLHAPPTSIQITRKMTCIFKGVRLASKWRKARISQQSSLSLFLCTHQTHWQWWIATSIKTCASLLLTFANRMDIIYGTYRRSWATLGSGNCTEHLLWGSVMTIRFLLPEDHEMKVAWVSSRTPKGCMSGQPWS